MKSVNPFTGKLIQAYDSNSEIEVDQIIEASTITQHVWSKTSCSERSAKMVKLGQLLRLQINDLATLVTHEMGKPVTQSAAEVEKCAWLCDYYSEFAKEFLKTETIETDANHSEIRYEPLGTILGIMPWNFPFWQAFRFFVPAVMAGNSCLLKHASNVTGCALKMEALFAEAGFPSNLLSVIKLSGEGTSALLSDERIRGVSLTGSEAAGRSVGMQSGKHIKTAVLELGGSNAFIVLKDADIELAVNDAIIGRFQNNGQSCIAAKRILVEEEVYEDFLNRFTQNVKQLWVGDPMDKQCFIGPLARVDLAEELHDQVERSIDAGAELVVGGRYQGAVYTPTLLTSVRPGMAAFDTETFGPVACVTKVSSIEEAITLSNQSNFGLGVSIYTENTAEVLKRVQEFDEGAVFINSIVKSDPRLPFGGVKNSGIGRELGREGVRAFVNVKTLYVNSEF